jgi:SAM-dependent methyltransferase
MGEARVDGVNSQRELADAQYSDRSELKWAFHYTSDPLTRYLRDRRLRVALDILRDRGQLDPTNQRVLLVCGGVGGEGTFLRDFGFQDVTVSDVSKEALESCRRFDPRLKTLLLNTEDMAELADNSYDIVLVQDGLHHLPRPVLGFTEMLRVARVAAIVIEPHYGAVGKLIGTEWEEHGDAVNYVFRWNRSILEQATRSYLLDRDCAIIPRRLWDHNLVLYRATTRLPKKLQVRTARTIYGALRPFNRLGNMMVGVVLKPDGPPPPRLTSH